MPPPRQGGDSAVVCPLRYIRNLDDLLRGAQSKNLILRPITFRSHRPNFHIHTGLHLGVLKPSQRFYAASMCGFVLSPRWVGVGSHRGFTAACAVLRLVSHMPLARFSFMRLSRLGGLRSAGSVRSASGLQGGWVACVARASSIAAIIVLSFNSRAHPLALPIGGPVGTSSSKVLSA